jgi:hypothetical protein
MRGRWLRASALAALVCLCVLVISGQAGADTTQTLTVEVVPAEEGQPLKFLVKLSAGPDSATFKYATEDGTAVAPGDYTAIETRDGTVEAGGELEIPVQTKPDAIDEFDETVVLNLTEIANATNTSATATGTITDADDDDPPTVVIEDVVVKEAAVTVPLSVTLSGPSGKPVSIEYRVGEASNATAGQDFKLAAGKLEFAPGATTKSIPVEILQDTRNESDEIVYVVFFNHVNVQTNDLEGKVTIEDDGDAPNAPKVPNASVVEGTPADGDPATTDLEFLISLAGPRPQTTFTYRTVTGSASAADLVEVGGAPVVLPASSQASPPPVSLKIKVRKDAIDELEETFTLELLNPSTDQVVATAIGTIEDDDNNSALSVGDASADEPRAATGSLGFTVSLSQASERPVSVAWRTENGTATAGSDYTAAAGVVEFAPGEKAKQVTVELLADGVSEANETLRLLLSDPQGVGPGKLVDAEAQGTIVDANAPPSLSISDTVTREGEGATFTVTLSGTTDRTVTVNFGTVDGTAKAGSDYVARVGTLSFAPGEKTKSLSVTVTDDTAAEPMEDFSMRLGDVVNGAITKSSGRALIEASDTAPAAPAPPVGTPAARPGPTAVKAPRMVLGPRTVPVTAAGVARMTVTCQRTSPIACAGTVELERAARPLLKLGKKAFTVRKGAKGVAGVKLSARSLAILRRNGTMRVRVIVVYKTSAGSARAVPGIVTLLAPKPAKPKPKPAEKPTQVEVTP